jgi:hypothetical protein
LNIGVKITIRFAVSEVPNELIGKFNYNENIGFNFADVCSEQQNVEIVIDDCSTNCHNC